MKTKLHTKRLWLLVCDTRRVGERTEDIHPIFANRLATVLIESAWPPFKSTTLSKWSLKQNTLRISEERTASGTGNVLGDFYLSYKQSNLPIQVGFINWLTCECYRSTLHFTVHEYNRRDFEFCEMDTRSHTLLSHLATLRTIKSDSKLHFQQSNHT
jgi:hypothetical protein